MFIFFSLPSPLPHRGHTQTENENHTKKTCQLCRLTHPWHVQYRVSVQSLSSTLLPWSNVPTTPTQVYLLQFNFILGLNNFIFLCFKLIIIHYHTQKQRTIKFKPRIKLNHNITVSSICKLLLHIKQHACFASQLKERSI